MPKTKAKSLDEFAAVKAPFLKITDLPEWDEMKAAYRRGIGPRVIYEWLLQEKGYTVEQIGNHSRVWSAVRDHAR